METYKLTMRIGALQMRRLILGHNVADAIRHAEKIGVPSSCIKAVHVASANQRARYKFLTQEDLSNDRSK